MDTNTPQNMEKTEVATAAEALAAPQSKGAKELQELESLLGLAQERTFSVNGTDVVFKVAKVKVKHIPKLIRAAGPLITPLMTPNSDVSIPQLMLFYPDECFNVLSVLCGQPREVVDELELDDAVLVLTDCIEANLDFFVRKLLPLLSGEVSRLLARVQENLPALESMVGTTVPKH